MIPCFISTPGTHISASNLKTIAIIGSGSLNTQASFDAFNPVAAGYPNATGFRQVASSIGNSFYLSGGGGANWGFRYLPTLTSPTTVDIIGQFTGQPGYHDARGVSLYAGKLYGTSSPADGSNARVVQIGGAVLPTSATNVFTPLPSMPTFNPWTLM